MNPNSQLSALPLISKAIVCTVLLAAAASAAPVYRGSFTLPYQVQWAQATLPAGDYLIRFQDIGSRPFLVVKEKKTGREVALLAARATEEATGPSVLRVTNQGNRHVICSLSLAELDEVFVYESGPAQGEEREALKTQTLPVVAAK